MRWENCDTNVIFLEVPNESTNSSQGKAAVWTDIKIGENIFQRATVVFYKH